LSNFVDAVFGNRRFDLLVLLLSFCVIGVVRIMGKFRTIDQFSWVLQWAIAEVMIISVVLFGVNSGSGFVYFKF